MKKSEFIARYGEAAYAKLLARDVIWYKQHPEERVAARREYTNKGGQYYERNLVYRRTCLQGKRNKVRANHAKQWRKYKNIIAPDAQIHHEWIPGTAGYRGVALVEADQHMHGIVDVIEILDGEITLLTEE